MVVTCRFGTFPDVAFLRNVLYVPLQFLPHDSPPESGSKHFKCPGRLVNGPFFYHLYHFSAARRLFSRSFRSTKDYHSWCPDLDHRQSYFQPGVDLLGAFPGAMRQRFRPGHGLDISPQTDCQLVSTVEARNGDRVVRNLCNRRQQCRHPAFRISW